MPFVETEILSIWVKYLDTHLVFGMDQFCHCQRGLAWPEKVIDSVSMETTLIEIDCEECLPCPQHQLTAYRPS